MEEMKCQSKDVLAENIAKLAELFPAAITEKAASDGTLERAVNFDLLQQLLSPEVLAGNEAYAFTWPGKKAAMAEAGRPVRRTLRPCPAESVNWDTTENVYIEGDNLEALKLLQASYGGRVKMIYIDPPYNTGNDFIYRDAFAMDRQEYGERTGAVVENEEGEKQRLFRNTDANGRFHSDWCSMIYPRLMLARNLLAEDGVIFISCDDNEHENLKKICNEVFGEENFLGNLIWKSKSGGANDSKYFAMDHEYILSYAKNARSVKILPDREASVTTQYNREDEHGKYALDRLDKQSIRYSPSLDYKITDSEGREYFPAHKDPAHPNATWRWSKKTVQEKFDELVFMNGHVYTKNYQKSSAIPRSLLMEERFGRTRSGKTENFDLFNLDLFSNPKPPRLIRYLSLIATRSDDIILDFFSGSATTAHAVMQLNAEDGGRRKFIMVQLPEPCAEGSEAAKAGYANICEIGKERIRRAGKKIMEEQCPENLDIGFRVFKCDSSNMKDVFYTPAQTSQKMLDELADNIKPDRNDLDLLYGCLTELGLPLSGKQETRDICGFTVHFYRHGDETIVCCFDADVSEEALREIAKLGPARAIFRDASFGHSREKINAQEIFKHCSPGAKLRVL